MSLLYIIYKRYLDVDVEDKAEDHLNTVCCIVEEECFETGAKLRKYDFLVEYLVQLHAILSSERV